MDTFELFQQKMQSSRSKELPASPTLKMAGRAQEMKREGKPIIQLSTGEPDFSTPEHVKEAIVKALHDNCTKYTPVPGIPELRSAVAEKFERVNGLKYRPEQISITSGGKQAIFNAMAATINPGDEVIIPAPLWVSYPDIVRFFGGIPVIVPCSKEQGFKLTADGLQKAISPRTKWLILNSPSNPTGAAYSKEELRLLADVLVKPENEHVWVLSDDIYEFIVFDDFEFHTIAAVEEKLYERTLTLNGFSKGYCMTGLRLGYCGGPLALIKAMNNIQSQSTTSASSIVQWGGVAALSGDNSFLQEQKKAFQRRRDLVLDLLSRVPGISCNRPEGAFYVYPDCSALIGKSTPKGKTLQTDEDFVEYLLEEGMIATIHGGAFMMSPHLRISYATSDELLEEALERMRHAVEKLV